MSDAHKDTHNVLRFSVVGRSAVETNPRERRTRPQGTYEGGSQQIIRTKTLPVMTSG